MVVGGGESSAGQAAVFLAQTSSKVHLLVRSSKLSESMSQYLVARIEAHSRIEIHYLDLSSLLLLTGTAHLESIGWKRRLIRTRGVTRPIWPSCCVMAGAAPRTEWLEDSFVMDKKGFIVTGPDLAEYKNLEWPLSRSPLLLETSVPGIFAVGDTRAGSVRNGSHQRLARARWRSISCIDSSPRATEPHTAAYGNKRMDLDRVVVDSL